MDLRGLQPILVFGEIQHLIVCLPVLQTYCSVIVEILVEIMCNLVSHADQAVMESNWIDFQQRGNIRLFVLHRILLRHALYPFRMQMKPQVVFDCPMQWRDKLLQKDALQVFAEFDEATLLQATLHNKLFPVMECVYNKVHLRVQAQIFKEFSKELSENVGAEDEE